MNALNTSELEDLMKELKRQLDLFNEVLRERLKRKTQLTGVHNANPDRR
jgi:hypothetical protein